MPSATAGPEHHSTERSQRAITAPDAAGRAEPGHAARTRPTPVTTAAWTPQPEGAHADRRGRAGPRMAARHTIFVDLPDGQCVRCRIVTILEDGTIQVVPEHSVAIT